MFKEGIKVLDIYVTLAKNECKNFFDDTVASGAKILEPSHLIVFKQIRNTWDGNNIYSVSFIFAISTA